ncbi:hypothetical protein FNF27_06654 [Cafeteria roenbergensis]|uniref:Uncharacterized protein n=1 Tax=Cafeteria roenbergensis TaxID=33653 RepID=A0A5A8CJV9_CAFRO|nr:hypothetical protein FNF29_03681 [Cafeteria roenbergensis]KAA0170397.1 hypothetical protein FNF27_06654 [Cafeteria roenbergensis]KAA0171456.1 hypothetical protein FNF28_00668 [Cafeteria roenbergensis]|eukprot:KAA0152794.1 hypothetical protein FNF29_03681 [Cafeteria roenbergensis]
MGCCASSSGPSEPAGFRGYEAHGLQQRQLQPDEELAVPDRSKALPRLPRPADWRPVSLATGPGTTFLAGGSNGTLAWYDAATASLLGEASLGGRSASNCTASAPSGPVPTCVASSPGKAITVWRLNAPGGASADSSDALELVASADAVKGERVSGVDISADARLVVTASKETFVRLWDVERGMAPSGRASASRNTATLALAGYVYFPLSIDIHPNGRHILTSSRGLCWLGDSMASSAVVTSSDGSLRVLEVSPEGRLAMTAELADEPDEASE